MSKFIIVAFALLLSLAAGTTISISKTNASGQAYMDAMQKMHHDMPKATGDADTDFAAMMIPHHQGAIDMAKIELQYGKDQKLKQMAEKIIGDQQKEIAELKEWLERRKSN